MSKSPTKTTNVQPAVDTNEPDEAGNTASGFDAAGFILYGFDTKSEAVYIGKKYVPIADMVKPALLYTVAMGWGQGVADAKAGLESAIMGTSKNLKARWSTKDVQEAALRHGLAMPNGVTESIKRQVVVLETNDALTRKAESILAGEVSSRDRGPRLVGFDKIFYDKAYAWLKNYCATRKVEFPKGDELRRQVAFVQSNPKVGPVLRKKAQEEHDFMNQTLEGFNLDTINAKEAA